MQWNCTRSIHLERQNKYFPYGPRSRLIRGLLYTYLNKPVSNENVLGPYALSASEQTFPVWTEISSNKIFFENVPEYTNIQ